MPEAVHRALTPGKDDTLRDAIHASSDLTLSRADTSEEGGPLRQQFLDFLAAEDLHRHVLRSRYAPLKQGRGRVSMHEFSIMRCGQQSEIVLQHGVYTF